jgi:hypothetical protein
MTPPFNPTTDPYTSTSYYKPNLVNVSSTSNLPHTYKQALLRDRPAHGHTVDRYNPRSRLAGHPLAPFIIVPQPPSAAQDLGIALEPSPGRGLHTPLVLAAPRSTTDMGWADDLSAHAVDSYILTCHYSTSLHTLHTSGYTVNSFHNRHIRRTRCSLPAQ